MVARSRRFWSSLNNGNHLITQGMTGSSSSIVTPLGSIGLLTLGLLLVSMTDGAAFINSDPTPKTALIIKDSSDQSRQIQPNVKIKFASQSGTVQPYLFHYSNSSHVEIVENSGSEGPETRNSGNFVPETRNSGSTEHESQNLGGSHGNPSNPESEVRNPSSAEPEIGNPTNPEPRNPSNTEPEPQNPTNPEPEPQNPNNPDPEPEIPYYDDDYYYEDQFESYSDEDLENVAASDDLHSHYFIKTNAKTEEEPIAPKREPQIPRPVVNPNVTETVPSSISAEIEDNIGSESVAGRIAHPEINDLVQTAVAINNFIPKEPVTTEKDTSTSIPGTPGVDYPIYEEVPYTGFDCQKQRYKGFFADLDAQCQAWHYCDFSDGHSAFLCPNGTLFSQVLLTCDWWFNVNCREAQQLYVLNERLYRYNKVPKPSFPEDFHGPQVDLWLLQQLQLGHLPKKRRLIIDKTVVSSSN